jgi:hypothetical protein
LSFMPRTPVEGDLGTRPAMLVSSPWFRPWSDAPGRRNSRMA